MLGQLIVSVTLGSRRIVTIDTHHKSTFSKTNDAASTSKVALETGIGLRHKSEIVRCQSVRKEPKMSTFKQVRATVLYIVGSGSFYSLPSLLNMRLTSSMKPIMRILNRLARGISDAAFDYFAAMPVHIVEKLTRPSLERYLHDLVDLVVDTQIQLSSINMAYLMFKFTLFVFLGELYITEDGEPEGLRYSTRTLHGL